METIRHEWTKGKKRYKAAHDGDYQTSGSYAYDTEEETKAAEDEETANLESGKWVVLGILTFERKRVKHCESCSCRKVDWQETDALWGCVIENSDKAIEAFGEDF